jgi:beta-galactosidase
MISLVDKAGNENHAAEKKLTVTVKGAGVLQGFGSANPVSEDDYYSGIGSTFYGKALAVVRPLDKAALSNAGEIELTVEAPGCEAKKLILYVKE